MKDEIKKLLDEAEIYEDVDVLGQAQSDAARMVKKLRSAILQMYAEIERARRLPASRDIALIISDVTGGLGTHERDAADQILREIESVRSDS